MAKVINENPSGTRRFVLNRLEDESGISGTGEVADGVEFRNGQCVLCWKTENAPSNIGIYPNIEAVDKIHGHGGKTKVEFLD